MNTSNRFEIETLARQRQAEIEKQLRQAAQLRSLRPSRRAAHPQIRWVAIGATALSVLGTIVFVVVAHVR